MRSNSHRSNTPATSTFAPTFITSEEMQSSELVVRGIEGENDFSGKRYVWLRDPVTAFVRGWVVEELDGDNLLVQCEDGSVSELVSIG
jgi:myosin protein heavy chain